MVRKFGLKFHILSNIKESMFLLNPEIGVRVEIQTCTVQLQVHNLDCLFIKARTPIHFDMNNKSMICIIKRLFGL